MTKESMTTMTTQGWDPGLRKGIWNREDPQTEIWNRRSFHYKIVKIRVKIRDLGRRIWRDIKRSQWSRVLKETKAFSYNLRNQGIDFVLFKTKLNLPNRKIRNEFSRLSGIARKVGIVMIHIGDLAVWIWEYERYCRIVLICEGKRSLRLGIGGILWLYGIRLRLGIKEGNALFKRDWEGSLIFTVLSSLDKLLYCCSVLCCSGLEFFIMAARVLEPIYSLGRMVLKCYMDFAWYLWIIWSRRATGRQQKRYVIWHLIIKMHCTGEARKLLEVTGEKQRIMIYLNSVLRLVNWFVEILNGVVNMAVTDIGAIDIDRNGEFLTHIEHMVLLLAGLRKILFRWIFDLKCRGTGRLQRWDWSTVQKIGCLALIMEVYRSSLSPQFPARGSLILIFK